MNIIRFMMLSTVVFFTYTDGLRLSSAPYISGDSFRACADHIFDETSRELNPCTIKRGDIVFVKTDYLNDFFTNIHTRIEHPYMLITHNSDYGVPGIFEHYLDDPKLYRWFGQNPTIHHHDKFIAIPIGIANTCWRHGDINTFNTVLGQGRLQNRKQYILGLNFAPAWYGSRDQLFSYFKKQLFCTDVSSSDHAIYLANMALCDFVLSPRGNGLDCHRTWEALLVGAIPIVETSCLDELFDGLSVVIVNDWKDITEEFLIEKRAEYRRKEFQNNKALFPYWQRLMLFYKNQLVG